MGKVGCGEGRDLFYFSRGGAKELSPVIPLQVQCEHIAGVQGLSCPLTPVFSVTGIFFSGKSVRNET